MRHIFAKLNHNNFLIKFNAFMDTVSAKVAMVVGKQIAECLRKGPDGVRVIFNESNMLDVQADIFGPVDTPYEGGVFRCKLMIEADFPNNPPKGYFLTKIFHPNVSEKGEICVNTLKKDWNPQAWSLYNILQVPPLLTKVIKCLLIVPFPESALNEEAGKIFMQDYQEYFKHARMLTELHAMPKELKSLDNVHQKITQLRKTQSATENMEVEQPNGLLLEKKTSLKKQNDKKKWMKRI